MENTVKMTTNADTYPRVAMPTGAVFHNDVFRGWLLHYVTRLEELKQKDNQASWTRRIDAEAR